MRRAAALALIALAAACGRPRGCARAEPGPEYVVDPAPPPPISDEVAGRTAGAIDLFGRDVYGALAGGEPNLVFSPASLAIALSMAYAGARGATATEMEATLHLPARTDDADRVSQDFGALLANLAARRGGTELGVAHRLYGRVGVPFGGPFLDELRDAYHAPLEALDFSDRARAAAHIDAWVSSRSRGKVPDLLSAGDLDPDTALVLVDAVYFRGDWESPFERTATKDVPFDGVRGSRTVRMMHDLGHMAYAETEDAQVVELPFKGDAVALDVVLPRTTALLARVERTLSASSLSALVSGRAPARVSLHVPRFRVSSVIDAKAVLSGLGMARAFDAATADFGGMSRERRLRLDRVAHRAFLEVNEEGAVAGAGTAAVMPGETGGREDDPPVEFRADHPFLFLLRHRPTGAILFAGRFAAPP